MSRVGQKQTLHSVEPMSALPPKADMSVHGLNVRYVPKADIVSVWTYRTDRAEK